MLDIYIISKHLVKLLMLLVIWCLFKYFAVEQNDSPSSKTETSSVVSWHFDKLAMLLCVFFLGGAPTSVCHFFHPSVRPSVARHISGTVHHLIIIFGTRFK